MSPSLPPLGSAIKVLVPVVVGVFGLGVMGILYQGQVEQTKRVQQQLAVTQQQVSQLQAQNQELSQQIESLQDERKALDDRLTSLRTQLATATSNVERSRVNLEELTHRIEQLASERTQLQQQVERLTGDRDAANQQVKQLQQAKAELERSVQQSKERLALMGRDYRKMEQKVAELEARPLAGVESVVTTTGEMTLGATTMSSTPSSTVERAAPSSISGTVELPPIIVRKDQAGVSALVRGRLMEVNREHHFIVVDKGSLDGVREGMAFDLLRSGSTVGRATVVRVRPQLAACDVVRAKTPGPLQVGDVAVQSGP